MRNGKLGRVVTSFVRHFSAAKRQGDNDVFKKVLLFGFLLGLSMVGLLAFAEPAASAQSIRLPFPPLYKSDLSQKRVPITQACENRGLHVNAARYAVDFGLVSGTPVYAPVSGTVVYAQDVGANSYGNLIRIKEDNDPDREHWLAHLSLFYVTGGHVDKGSLIALSGETGIGPQHLHYHVQSASGGPIDVRGQLPNMFWDDPSDFCEDNEPDESTLDTDTYDGWAHADPHPNGIGANNCAEFYNQGRPGVWGFDAPHCQGNVVFGALGAGADFNLAQAGVNDRLRSVSTPQNLKFWLYGNVDDDFWKHCHDRDMWNLDTDFYNDNGGTDTRIGFDTNWWNTGWNMVSRVVVTTDACPDQVTRASTSVLYNTGGIGGGSDTLPPVTNAFYKEPDGNNGWYVTSVPVTLVADDEAGVANTYYQIDGGSVNEGTSFTLSTDAIYNVCFWSVDVNGNTEAARCVQIMIDQTPPVTMGTAAGSRDMLGIFRSPVDNTLSAEDNLSGVEKTETSFDVGSIWNPVSGVFTLEDNGVYEYLFRSVDVAGNVEQAKSSGTIDIARFALLADTLLSVSQATTLQVQGVAHTNSDASFTNNTTVYLETLEYMGQFSQSGNVSFTIDNLIQTTDAVQMPLYPLSFYRSICTFIQGPITVTSTSPVYNECWYVDDDVTLETTGATGNLTIVSEGVIHDRSTNSQLTAWDTTNGVLFWARCGYVTESTGAVYQGVVYAPFASLSGAFTNATLNGGQFAESASLGSGTTLNAQQAAGFPTSVFALPLSAPGAVSPNLIYVSSTTGGTSGGVSFADEDVLTYNREADTYTMYIDGSDIGLTNTDIDAFALMPDGTILLSFDASISITGLGTVYDADIVAFTPTSLGSNTAGSFSWYLDGSDVGLTTSYEDVDAIGFTPDGKLVVSTLGSFSVSGVSGNDEDLLVFTATQLGATTSGTWAMYFDGSDVSLNESSYEDVNGVFLDKDTGQVYLTTVGSFSVSGVVGDGADVFVCTPSSLGSNTACTYGPGLYWDGSKNGWGGEVLDAFEIQK